MLMIIRGLIKNLLKSIPRKYSTFLSGYCVHHLIEERVSAATGRFIIKQPVNLPMINMIITPEISLTMKIARRNFIGTLKREF